MVQQNTSVGNSGYRVDNKLNTTLKFDEKSDQASLDTMKKAYHSKEETKATDIDKEKKIDLPPLTVGHQVIYVKHEDGPLDLSTFEDREF